MFSRFDTVLACDRRTDEYGQTDRRTDVQPISITCFSIADARKNTRSSAVAEKPRDAVYYYFGNYRNDLQTSLNVIGNNRTV